MSSPVSKEDPGNSSEFSEFAKTCEAIRSTRSKLAKVDTLSKYFAKLPGDEDLRIASTILSGRIFPPGFESQEVNVGYSLIWKTFSELTGLKDEDISKYYLKHGDLGSVVEDVLTTKRFAGEALRGTLFHTALTLQEVHSTFQELSRATGQRSQQRKQQILSRLLSSVREPVEAKYIVRILTGEMRIGLVEGLVEESIAKCFGKTLTQIRTANLVSGSTGLVAVLAKHHRLSEARIEPSRPTNFMLADTAESAKALFEKFERMPVLSEYKYDGIRAQIHLRQGKVRIFSRNLEDITRYFPEVESAIKRAGNAEMILDGEIIAFSDSGPLPFQLLQRRLRKLTRSAEDVPIRYFAFDLLFYNGSLIESELSRRVEILRSIHLDGISFSEQRSVSSPEEIAKMFEESKSLGYEGLVVKDPGSSYTPGRRGKSWIKLKRELDTLDVVVVAAEYGHGKRAGVISDYTFAVRDGDNLKVVGKAYSGLTDEEISEMTELLKQITLRDYGYRRTVKPQVVLEVAFDAIQRSDRHDSGFALRFPRIKRIRKDKSLQDIDTIEKVRRIYEAQKVKA